MFTCYEFVYVDKWLEYSAKRNSAGFAIDRSYRLLKVRIPKTNQVYMFLVNREINVAPLRRNDKIKVYFDLFLRANNKNAELKVIGIDLV
ncbi:TPA: hypothetical protein ITR69_000061 [Enterococcus faecalis]|nr:hypothetical protein [Enterococcus faecalis]HAP2781581.1 hypothetical protein [Enterococcus faecalis]